MGQKSISQLVRNDGEAIAVATSAPNCFIHDGQSPENAPNVVWGDVFSEPRSGNAVNFYVTGEEYFKALEGAFASAREAIYITGWQVNFDVELTDGRTLFEHLEGAIEANTNLRIYVMPWLSPKVNLDTGDFETMLAIYQLNAGLAGPQRAFAMPAMGQSDMKAGLAIGFSHHQKLVVVDNKIAFVGGMDLAYGRRDDGKFSLAANGRTGNEHYNSCIPPIENITSVQQTRYLMRLELLAACFDGKKGSVGTFAMSAPMVPVAHVLDTARAASDVVKDKNKQVADWWNSFNILPDFIRAWQKLPAELAGKAASASYYIIDQQMDGRLEFLRSSGSANAASAASALFGWLNNASMEQLPHELREETVELIQMLTISALSHLQRSADNLPTRYENLKKLRKIVPKSGKAFSVGQPRMPWHDVHSSIEGPSVSDLAKNFELRWNSVARRYEDSCQFVSANVIVRGLFSAFGHSPTARLKLPRIPPSPLPKAQPIAGRTWVQVLRSAPLTLLRDEAKAMSSRPQALAQNNCLKAMLTAINGAQKFLYIEGQFFQCEYGRAVADPKLSGPMGALIDIRASSKYKQHAETLGIGGAAPEEILKKMKWMKISEVEKDKDFINDLYSVLKNIALVKASSLMGKAQERMLNPLGEAIAKRIEKAIADALPFHVYMVLPAHPEGTLNTLNIMTQLHLTMQSIVFGSDSLINRIRKAIVIDQLRRKQGISTHQAREIVASYDIATLTKECQDEWKEYITILNLRTWENLSDRPITEQIYIHSKLLIADDRVAVLGSANINDRSQLGDRDSELAVIIRDDVQVRVKLDGIRSEHVSKSVNDLRNRLWKKIFGLMGGESPALTLAPLIDKPAARETWNAIQEIAHMNALAYQNAFAFFPRIIGGASSIWPTWNTTTHKLDSFMPFSERFWRPANIREATVTWDATHIGRETKPSGVRGFFVALPLTWTAGENNMSGVNLTMLAQNDSEHDHSRHVADTVADPRETDSNV